MKKPEIMKTPSNAVDLHRFVSHADLVTRGERWLRSSCGCSVVFSELVAYTLNGETPDAIGWVGGKSILVECKASRADFLRDRKKQFRGMVEGMGAWRFYLVPPGIVAERDCPEGWGIYEFRDGRVHHAFGAKYANAKRPPFQPCYRSENALLLSALRRLANVSGDPRWENGE